MIEVQRAVLEEQRVELGVTGAAFTQLQQSQAMEQLLFYTRIFARFAPEQKVSMRQWWFDMCNAQLECSGAHAFAASTSLAMTTAALVCCCMLVGFLVIVKLPYFRMRERYGLLYASTYVFMFSASTQETLVDKRTTS